MTNYERALSNSSNLIKAENVNQVSDKVVLTTNQHEALETFRAKGITNKEIITSQIEQCLLQVNGYEYIAQMDVDDLIRALYIGYTVEETTEEKILKMYKNPHNYYDESDGQWGAFQSGVYNTLQKLRIKIEGINA